MKDENPGKENMETLDAAWSLMEIMGVGMVDMKVWKWLYGNPEASPAQLKENTIAIAKNVWNKYFAPVLEVKDSPILAIYSHMIDAPLYLANYSYGHIIQFQIEEYLKRKDLSHEIGAYLQSGASYTTTMDDWCCGCKDISSTYSQRARQAFSPPVRK